MFLSKGTGPICVGGYNRPYPMVISIQHTKPVTLTKNRLLVTREYLFDWAKRGVANIACFAIQMSDIRMDASVC